MVGRGRKNGFNNIVFDEKEMRDRIRELHIAMDITYPAEIAKARTASANHPAKNDTALNMNPIL